MITIWKERENRLIKSALLEKYSWIQVTAPTELEMKTLEQEYDIEPDIIRDILDADERSRSEREDGIHYIIIRIPVVNENSDPQFSTIPLGIIILENLIVTVCMKDVDILKDFSENRVRSSSLSNYKTFILKLFFRVAKYYLNYLKEINKRTAIIETELQKSIKNTELIRLLTLEKSLVFFTTSLKANELLVEKLNKTFFTNLSEDEQDLLEDVVIENRQAIEMANIYSNILSGMMDAFASVISNNLNVVMKRLTMISITLMFPTLIASLYGMNVKLPFMNSPHAFTGILIGCFVTAGLSAAFLSIRRIFR